MRRKGDRARADHSRAAGRNAVAAWLRYAASNSVVLSAIAAST
ncbi:signal transduction histidine kinase domain protein [Burkholderia humptydooensis]|nr:hypothetical protein [Burkholderia humptydooensis]AJY40796.1 signal transduction histidine kinase domain protein [Burkholderia sp. 2002721687]